MKLRVEGVTWQVEARAIIDDVDLEIGPAEFVGLIGPNGSGKSSLLRTIYRALKPNAGLIVLDGDDVWRLSAREAALRTAVVTQERSGDFDFNVYEIVMMGRNPHKGIFDRDNPEDFRLVEEALKRVDMFGLAQRSFQTLSGGEKQRVMIARALAQQAGFLVLDEPTNHLDIRYQLEILELVKGLGVATLAALHDLNLAALYCDRLYVLNQGRLVAAGPPEAVLTPQLIGQVYGVKAQVQRHPLTGKLHITYFPGKWVNGPTKEP